MTVHLILLPLAYELSLISPDVSTSSLHEIVLEVSSVGTTISPVEGSVSIFLALGIDTFENSSVGPNFLSVSALLVGNPTSLVVGTVSIGVLAISLSLSILPLTLIVVAI